MSGKSKTALITGGSNGIGLELAKVFAREGYDLILVARGQSNLDSASMQLLQKYRVSVKTIAKDLAKIESAKEIFEQLASEHIKVDALVNNAGFAVYGRFDEQKIEDLLNMINLNINTLVYLTHLFLPQMIESKNGKILNVSSTAAFQPGPLMAVYYASKSFVLPFSEALRAELKDHGIAVTALCPGPTKTNFFNISPEIKQTNLLSRVGTLDPGIVAEAGYKGLLSNKSVVVPGFIHWFLAFGTRLVPRNMATLISYWTLRKK